MGSATAIRGRWRSMSGIVRRSPCGRCRQRGIEGAGAAGGCTRPHLVQTAVHGIALAGAPGETGQLPDRTRGEVTGDRGERSGQPGDEVKVTARDGGRGTERRVLHRYRPGAGQRARRDPDETALCRVAAYSSPLTESADAGAAIAAAGLMTRAAAAATGTIHPSHRMTYPPSSRPVSRTPRAPAYASRQRGPTAADSRAGGAPHRQGCVVAGAVGDQSALRPVIEDRTT